MEKIKNFIKEHKMLVAISALVVVIAIVVAILLLTSNEDKLPTSGNDTTVDTSTDNSSSSEEDYLSGIGTAPDDDSTSESLSDKDNADEFPDGSESSTSVNDSENDDSQESTDTTVDPDDKNSEDDSTEPTDPDDDKSSEDDTTPSNPSDEPEEPVHTCNYNTVKYDSSNHWYVCSCGKTANKSAHNYSSEADTTCNTCGHTREVATPEPEKPSTVPSVSWTGTPITLPTIGVSLPVLKDFNDEALTDNTNNTGWAGAVSTDAEQQLADTLNAVMDAVIDAGIISATDQGFAFEQYQISWSYASYSVSNDIMLYRNPLDKTYTLTINTPLDSDVFGIHDVAPYSRDVLLTMCSVISSSPNELYSYIYRGLYEDSSILNTSKYKTVGDCKVKLDENFYFTETSMHVVFYIKAN